MRKLFTALVVSLVAFGIFLQVNGVSTALALPLTSPATFFGITGTVTYKNLARFFNFLPKMFPADNVTVKATDLFNSSHNFSGQTDSNGHYELPADAGLYQVEMVSLGGFFVPPLKIVNVKNSPKTADFQGLILP